MDWLTVQYWYSMIQIHHHRLVCFIFIGLFGDSKVIDTQDTGGGTYVFWMHWKLPNIHGYATFSNYFLVEARLKKNEESKSSYFNKHQRGQRQQASWTAELLNCWTSIILIYHMICTLGTNYQTAVHILSITVPFPHPHDGKGHHQEGWNRVELLECIGWRQL